MRSEVLALALIVGAFTWAFRYLPIRANLMRFAGRGVFGRFLAATGPAAIATLFVSSAAPMAAGGGGLGFALGAGVVVLVYRRLRSVVLATLLGALTYGLTHLF